MPNACAVRTLEMISSAIVEAFAYSVITSLAYFAINPPPMVKRAMMVGTIQDRISANFQLLANAIIKAEKNAASDMVTIAILTLTLQNESCYLIRDSFAKQFRVIRYAICYFTSAKPIKKRDVLTKNSFQIQSRVNSTLE